MLGLPGLPGLQLRQLNARCLCPLQQVCQLKQLVGRQLARRQPLHAGLRQQGGWRCVTASAPVLPPQLQHRLQLLLQLPGRRRVGVPTHQARRVAAQLPAVLLLLQQLQLRLSRLLRQPVVSQRQQGSAQRGRYPGGLRLQGCGAAGQHAQFARDAQHLLHLFNGRGGEDGQRGCNSKRYDMRLTGQSLRAMLSTSFICRGEISRGAWVVPIHLLLPATVWGHICSPGTSETTRNGTGDGSKQGQAHLLVLIQAAHPPRPRHAAPADMAGGPARLWAAAGPAQGRGLSHVHRAVARAGLHRGARRAKVRGGKMRRQQRPANRLLTTAGCCCAWANEAGHRQTREGTQRSSLRLWP